MRDKWRTQFIGFHRHRASAEATWHETIEIFRTKGKMLPFLHSSILSIFYGL